MSGIGPVLLTRSTFVRPLLRMRSTLRAYIAQKVERMGRSAAEGVVGSVTRALGRPA